MSNVVRPPLAPSEYEEIFSKVPRLTVEVVISSTDGVPLTRRVLLIRRRSGPCQGLWHIPGGTVRFGEPLTDAVLRVARQELDLAVSIDRFLGYIEYPSHFERGLDWPVGMAFAVHPTPSSNESGPSESDDVGWFGELPDAMHDEQKLFLRSHGTAT